MTWTRCRAVVSPAGRVAVAVRATSRAGAALALALAVAGCGMFDRRPAPPCPPVLVVKEASKLTLYREGPGRDVTDVLFEGQVVDFRGGCEWNRARTEVDLEIRVAFDVQRGPANRDRRASFRYFVAIPAFHPAPEGKRVFLHEVAFPENVARLRSGDTVRLRIPIAKGKTWEDYPVYIGFQLTPEQAERLRPGG